MIRKSVSIVISIFLSTGKMLSSQIPPKYHNQNTFTIIPVDKLTHKLSEFKPCTVHV